MHCSGRVLKSQSFTIFFSLPSPATFGLDHPLFSLLLYLWVCEHEVVKPNDSKTFRIFLPGRTLTAVSVILTLLVIVITVLACSAFEFDFWDQSFSRSKFGCCRTVIVITVLAHTATGADAIPQKNRKKIDFDAPRYLGASSQVWNIDSTSSGPAKWTVYFKWRFPINPQFFLFNYAAFLHREV